MTFVPQHHAFVLRSRHNSNHLQCSKHTNDERVQWNGRGRMSYERKCIVFTSRKASSWPSASHRQSLRLSVGIGLSTQEFESTVRCIAVSIATREEVWPALNWNFGLRSKCLYKHWRVWLSFFPSFPPSCVFTPLSPSQLGCCICQS